MGKCRQMIPPSPEQHMEHTAGAQMAVMSPGNKYLPWDRPHMGSLRLVKVSLLCLWNKSRGSVRQK